MIIEGVIVEIRGAAAGTAYKVGKKVIWERSWIKDGKPFCWQLHGISTSSCPAELLTVKIVATPEEMSMIIMLHAELQGFIV